MNESCVICGTIKNCAEHIDKVFNNIKKIIRLFKEYQIILYYDDSCDDTLKKLYKYKEYLNIKIHHNKTYFSANRTHRLAFGRNYCLKKINKYFSHYKYFIMMDLDDVCSNDIHISVLEKNIINDTNWDALSFNKENYYDLWALSIRPYIFSYIHFNNPSTVAHNMHACITNKLNMLRKNELLKCYSAFNGFSIYKTEIFKDSYYNGRICLNLIPKNLIEETKKQNNSEIVFYGDCWLNARKEDCEHRAFHFYAIHKKNARIRISPEVLF